MSRRLTVTFVLASLAFCALARGQTPNLVVIYCDDMGWGDAPGADTHDLLSALAKFDPQGLAQALGRDEDHTKWFADVCEMLLPNYTFSLGWDQQDGPRPAHLPVIPLRANVPAYQGPSLPWPPGWGRLWSSVPRISLPAPATGPNRAGAPSDADR